MQLQKLTVVAMLSSLLLACSDQSNREIQIEASVEIQFVPLTGAEPKWVSEATPIQFPNLTTLFVHPRLLEGSGLVREEGRDAARKNAPYLTVQIPLGSGPPVDVSDKVAGNGELAFRGRKAKGRTFYLETNGRLFTSTKGSSPLDDLLEKQTGSTGR